MKAKRPVRLEMAEWKSAWKPRNVHVSIRNLHNSYISWFIQASLWVSITNH